MKKIFINVFILIFSLLVLGLFIYLGQFFTKLRYNNKTSLSSLDSAYQISLKDWGDTLNNINNSSSPSFWNDFDFLSRFASEIKLKDTFGLMANDYQTIANGGLISAILNNQENALQPLAELLQSLKLLENYHLNFVAPLEYQIQNWLTFLGYEHPTTYLLVFQDTNIPRPTGGFLGGYGLLSFNKGKMSLKGDSIFDLDDLFLDKIVPPEELRSISNKWFTHDANWFFDFPQTSKKLLDFYQKTGLTPSSLDGVIAINDSVISSLLNLTGPLPLQDYGLTIDANNFESFFNQQITNASQFSSSEGREVFTEFLSVLFKHLQTLSQSQLESFQKILADGLSHKDLQIYSTNDQLEYYFDSLDWSGKILDGQDDYLAVVFNDLNKNFLLDRRSKDIQLETNISSSTVTDTLTIKSQFSNYSEKNLETYLQIYLPQGTTLINVSGGYLANINKSWPYDKLNYQKDSDLSTFENKTITDETKGVKISEIGQKTVISTWAKLGAEPLVLTYQFPLINNNFDHWQIQIQKQSGQNISFAYNLLLPPDKKIAPTLFVFKKPIPLDQDWLLNFDIKSL
ncbi:MAG: DUF4012 domain-containing protein [Minisyncoccia bacterium]